MGGPCGWQACSSGVRAPPPAPEGPGHLSIQQTPFSCPPHSFPVSVRYVLTPHGDTAVSQGMESGTRTEYRILSGGHENSSGSCREVFADRRREDQEGWLGGGAGWFSGDRPSDVGRQEGLPGTLEPPPGRRSAASLRVPSDLLGLCLPLNTRGRGCHDGMGEAHCGHWGKLTECCPRLSASVSPLTEWGSCLPSGFVESCYPCVWRSALLVLPAGAHGGALHALCVVVRS